MARVRDEFQRGSLVVAHRGASAAEPENTVEAFEAAAAAGADVIELDVRLTSDGVPVVLHDAQVASTTDGNGWVHELTLAEVKALDAGVGSGSRHEIPTLAEALEAAGRGGVSVNLEIKNLPGEPSFDSPDEAVLRATLDVLDATGYGGAVLLSSFNWITIERAKELTREVATGFLTIGPIDAWAAFVYVRQRGHEFVLPQATALLPAGEAFVRKAHDEGIAVGTWVVDDDETLEMLFGWGVDAVASNDPVVAVAVRDRVVAQ